MPSKRATYSHAISFIILYFLFYLYTTVKRGPFELRGHRCCIIFPLFFSFSPMCKANGCWLVGLSCVYSGREGI
ncbi:hypothetical protein QBC44DRAFT_322846 [Cladorrhinum sp. PSN332]|nr:hypothetical protein QBC44DRAFT_322846 [Cladorrhinum sp. PSN332]